jgi:hypothetical protein
MASKHLARALTAALRAASKKAPPDDRAFITRWIAEADDPAFERLVTDLIEQGEIGDDPFVICRTLISLAHREWYTATDLKDGVDSISQQCKARSPNCSSWRRKQTIWQGSVAARGNQISHR